MFVKPSFSAHRLFWLSGYLWPAAWIPALLLSSHSAPSHPPCCHLSGSSKMQTWHSYTLDSGTYSIEPKSLTIGALFYSMAPRRSSATTPSSHRIPTLAGSLQPCLAHRCAPTGKHFLPIHQGRPWSFFKTLLRCSNSSANSPSPLMQ